MDRGSRVLQSERLEHLLCLGDDRISVVRGDARFQSDLEASAIARFEGDVQVGARVLAPVTCFGGSRLSGFCRTFHFFCADGVAGYFSFSKIASVIWTVEAAPWLIDFEPPGSRIMS